jgi:uncharacterized membrane protein YkvA (DUF1232 family)
MPDKFIIPQNDPIPRPPSWLVTPLSARGWPVWLVYLIAIIGVLYLLNPTAGILEFIPDNIPIIGNLDEGVACILIYAGLLEFFEGWRYRQALKPDKSKNSDNLSETP